MTEHAEKCFLLRNLPRADALRKLAALCGDERGIAALAAYSALMETSSDLLHRINSLMGHHGLTQARWRVLFRIYSAGEGGISPCELACILRVERATVTSLLDGLERDGFIRREPSPDDRRSIKARLTAKGSEHLKVATPERMAHIKELMSALSEQECKTLLTLLDKLARRSGEQKS